MNYVEEYTPEVVDLGPNERFSIIADIYKKYKLLGIDKRRLKVNRLWYNDTFDILYHISGEDLLRFDTDLRDLVFKKYGTIATDNEGRPI